MKIWVDGDAMPKAVKQILYRRVQRDNIEMVLVANVALKHPEHACISSVVVEGGLDVADDWIAERVEAGDLVITADIPLAARVVEGGATALDPRGKLYTAETVPALLATRNLLTELRNSSVIEGGGPPPYSKKDQAQFANAFNAYLVSQGC